MGSPLRAVAALALAVLAAGGLVFLLMRKPALPGNGSASIEQLTRDNQSLRDRVAQLERELQAVRLPHPESRAPVDPVRRTAPAAGEEARLETVRALAQTQARLQAATAALAELREKTTELEADVARLDEENRKLQSAGEDTRENLASARRIVGAMEAELKSKSERIAQMEAAARKPREESAAGAQKLRQWSALASELEDINRRRENTLTQLQRRYRDLTDLYRALAVRLDNQRDNPAPLTPDLSRIQSTVQSAEDDLRQIVSLNTQAARAAQRLAAQK
jgi:chromosome segregation ATPase